MSVEGPRTVALALGPILCMPPSELTKMFPLSSKVASSAYLVCWARIGNAQTRSLGRLAQRVRRQRRLSQGHCAFGACVVASTRLTWFRVRNCDRIFQLSRNGN